MPAMLRELVPLRRLLDLHIKHLHLVLRLRGQLIQRLRQLSLISRESKGLSLPTAALIVKTKAKRVILGHIFLV